MAPSPNPPSVNSFDHDPFGLHKYSYSGTQSGRYTSIETLGHSSAQHSKDAFTKSEKHVSSSDGLLVAETKGGKAPERQRRMVALFVGAAVLLALAISIPIGLAVTTLTAANATPKPEAHEKGNGSTSIPNPPVTLVVSGGDGSTITAEDGSTFIYSNKFGGFWVSDPNNPFNNNAQPNSWTPPLNQSWDFNEHKIFGVNLGGLFVLEPFIVPALFQQYPDAVDEWSLSVLMAADTVNGGLDQLEHHYDTFITEKDIAEIAGAGLNWVRLPIPFWAIDRWDGEPFLEKTSWKYIVRILGWCRKYGLRVNLDLHTIPGSQNGYDHSGRRGQINFLHGAMGLANAQRALNYIRVIAEFISQPEWKDVVPMFGFINEPMLSAMGTNALRSFYVEAYRIIRGIAGYGTGNGPYIGIHDGFIGPTSWSDFMRGADRVVMDMHPYFAFNGGMTTEPIGTGTGATAGGVWPARACQVWNGFFSDSRTNFGLTIAGEWSNGFNDCGLYLRGVGFPPTYAGNCDLWQNSTNWDSATKAGVRQMAAASMDALDSWFFWTWKIGNSTRGIVESPLWSYQLGLQGGWMPQDPRTAYGTCSNIGAALSPVPGDYPTWMTGGAGAGPPRDAADYPWPPATIVGGGVPAAVPQYTATGVVPTLYPPTFTGTDGLPIGSGNGWLNTADSAPAPTAIEGCTYPDAWGQGGSNETVPPGCLA